MSVGLHVIVLSGLAVFQIQPKRWTPTPTVYQVDLVGPEEIVNDAPEPIEMPEPEIPEIEIEPETEEIPEDETIVEPEIEKIPERPKPPEKPVIKKKPEPKKSEPVKTSQPAAEKNADKSDSAQSKITGTNRMNIDIENFPFAYYLNLLRRRIQNNWQPPRRSERLTAMVGFEILRNGQIMNIVIENRSGNFLFDQAAQRAVHYANPLPPLPGDFHENKLSVHIEFEGL